MMKLFISICYLLAFIPYLRLARKAQDLEDADEFRRSELFNSLQFFIFQSTLLFNFWLLTGFFSGTMFFIAFVLSLAGWLINKVVGAITGFGLLEKKKKIDALGFFSIANGGWGCGFVLISILIPCAIFGTFWTYWKYPVSDPKAMVLIALFHFSIFHLARFVGAALVNWIAIASPYIDDDFRNLRLTSDFGEIIFSYLPLFMPLWVLNGDASALSSVLTTSLPETWILLSIPIVCFLINSLAPFFIGMFSYRSQVRAMIRWKKVWLESMLAILRMPKGDNRTDEWREKVDELFREIVRRSEENELLKLFVRVNIGEERALMHLPAETTYTVDLNSEAAKVWTVEQVSHARKILRGKFEIQFGNMITRQTWLEKIANKGHVPREEAPSLKSIAESLDRHKSQLISSDIRFAYLDQLLSLLGTVAEGDRPELLHYIESESKKASDMALSSPVRKNWIAGMAIAGLSSGILVLLKEYHADILAFFSKIVFSHP